MFDVRRRFRNDVTDILQSMLMVLRCALTELSIVRQRMYVCDSQ